MSQVIPTDDEKVSSISSENERLDWILWANTDIACTKAELREIPSKAASKSAEISRKGPTDSWIVW